MARRPVREPAGWSDDGNSKTRRNNSGDAENKAKSEESKAEKTEDKPVDAADGNTAQA